MHCSTDTTISTHGPISLFQRIQSLIESLYRIEALPEISAFIQITPSNAQAKEDVIIREVDDMMEIGVCFDAHLAALGSSDAAFDLPRMPLNDLMMIVEGVSHFVYLTHRARIDQQAKAIEMEFQSDVDKFLSAIFLKPRLGIRPATLMSLNAQRFTLRKGLTAIERRRYRQSNALSSRYIDHLHAHYYRTGRFGHMLRDLRTLFRSTWHQKHDLVWDTLV